MNPRHFLAAVIEAQIQYTDEERDVVVVRTDVKGTRDGKPARALYQMIDYRDLETGHSAMSRTVGFTASVGALLIARGRIARRGVLSPVRDVPYDLLLQELEKRSIHIRAARLPVE